MAPAASAASFSANAEDLTLCSAAWDPANALVEMSKEFEEQSGIDMAFEFTPGPNFTDRILNKLNLSHPAPVDPQAITAKATLDRVEHLGDQNRLHMSLGEHKLITLGDGFVEYHTKAGESVTLQVHSGLYFDGAGVRVW